MKFIILLISLLFSVLVHSQEYTSTRQTVHLFGGEVIEGNQEFYFTIKDGYIQQTNKRRMRVINIFDIDVSVEDDMMVSKMKFIKEEETTYLEYITVNLETQEIARIVYYLE